MKIEIRHGDDWLEVFVDGELFSRGHSNPIAVWADLLRKAGADVTMPEGDFDEDSGEWVPA